MIKNVIAGKLVLTDSSYFCKVFCNYGPAFDQIRAHRRQAVMHFDSYKSLSKAQLLEPA